MRKRLFCSLLFLTVSMSPGFSLEEEAHPFLKLEPKTQQEALFLRRIVEFWDEKSYELVESQILTFVDQFPNSELNDSLHALLGDLYSFREDHGRALQAYSKIVSDTIHEQVLLSQLQCLHLTNRYSELTKIVSPFLDRYTQSKKEKSIDIVSLVADSYYQLAASSSDPKKAAEFAQNAQVHFERLLRTDRAPKVLEPLAFLHHMLSENERAADLYLMAAQSNQEKEAELLFKAANIQTKFDKVAALDTFSRLSRMKNEHTSEAAFNRMVLLFDTKKFGDLVLAKDQLKRQIPKNARTMLHFFLGRSYYELDDHKRAVQELVEFVDESEGLTIERKTALLTLVECARVQKNFSQFDHYFALLEKEYPKATEIPEAIFVRAMMNKEHDYLEDARRDLERLIAEFPNYNNPILMRYEYAKILFDVEDFVLSRLEFKELLDSNPDHPMNPLAWHYFVQSSISLASFDTSKTSFSKDQLAFDLELFLEQPDLLTVNERHEYELLLAKTNYEIQAYEEAIELLNGYLKQDLKSSLASEGYLILAYCYRKGMNDLAHFCEYAEKALAVANETTDPSVVHLGLFNTYLKRSQEDAENKETFLTNAAEHLYLAQKKGAGIKQKNKIWLADFYFVRVKNPEFNLDDQKKSLYMARSTELFEKAFQTSSVQLIILDEATVCYVPYVLKLAELYEMQGQRSKKREILAQLHSQHILNPGLKWILVDEIFYELANEYSKIPEKQKEALSLYEQILERSSSLQKYLTASSCLSSARLRYGTLEEKIDRMNPELQKVLSQLKSLSIQREISNEPIHLEASLDYIQIHCLTEASEERVEKRLELLTKTLASFQQTEDVLARDYHLKRKEMPEKDRLFAQYVTFFEAEILYCKSQLANKETRLEDENYGDEAKELYLRLKDEVNITEYLKIRIELRLKDLQKSA